jgi:hypothetical protein
MNLFAPLERCDSRLKITLPLVDAAQRVLDYCYTPLVPKPLMDLFAALDNCIGWLKIYL